MRPLLAIISIKEESVLRGIAVAALDDLNLSGSDRKIPLSDTKTTSDNNTGQ